MVRRYRIGDDEVTPVMRNVLRSLPDVVTIDTLPKDAYSLFATLWGLKEHRTGSPYYPAATGEATNGPLGESSATLG